LRWHDCAEMGQFGDPKGESEVLEEATEYLIQQSIGAGDDEEDELDSSDEADQPQIPEPVFAAAHPEGRTQHGKDEISVRSASATGDAVHDADLRTAELLQDSNMTALAAGVTAEDDSRQADAIPSFSNTRAEEFELYDSRSSEELSITSVKADQEEQTERDWSEDLDVGMSQELNEEEDYDSDDSEEAMGPELSEERLAEMALATARQSSTWGRIIRPPRKKGRHIIVDLCTSLSALPKHRQAEVAASCQAAQGKLSISLCLMAPVSEQHLGPAASSGRSAKMRAMSLWTSASPSLPRLSTAGLQCAASQKAARVLWLPRVLLVSAFIVHCIA